MKPAGTLFSLLTVAVAGVVVVTGQFVTSTTTATPGLVLRSNDATPLDVRQDDDTDRRVTIRTRIITTRISTSTRRRTTTSRNSNNNNDDDNDDNDTTTRPPTRTSSTQTSISTSPTTTNKPDTDTTTPPPTPTDSLTTPSSTTSPNNNTSTKANTTPSGLSAGAAAGIAAGAVAITAIVAAVAFLLWRRRQGGIRGAVVTADYPRGMSDVDGHMDGASGAGGQKMDAVGGMPVMFPGGRGGQDGDGQAGGKYTGEVIEEHDLGDGRRSSSVGGGSGETLFKVPPAGTMPGDPAFVLPSGGGGEYPPQQQPQQQQQQWLGGDLGEARPVSAFTAYPSPGQPIFPVSPMTPYRPDSSILMAAQHPQSQVSPYHPGPGSPDMPAFLIPGGNRTRAMSFSSVAHIGGGGPHVAELVGSPPLSRAAVPSFAAVIEEQSPNPRQSHAELP